MMEGMRTLKVFHFGDAVEEDCHITIQPMAIRMLATFDAEKRGRPVKRVVLMFNEGDSTEICVSDMDALTIEQAVGSYGFSEV